MDKEYCWWCLLLTPIICVILINFILYMIIEYQFDQVDILDNKVNIIVKPWRAFDNSTIIHCDYVKPCNITCIDYYNAAGHNLDGCDFNYLIIIICYTILIICDLTLVCSILKIIFGYYCYDKKEVQHFHLQQAEV